MDFVKSNSLKSLIVDHEYNWRVDFESQNQRPWTLDELKFISGRIHISEIAAHCLDTNEDNFADFVDVFATLGNFDLTMNSDLLEYNYRRHLFQVDELELLIEKDIRLTYLNDLYLLREFHDIGEFFSTFKKMKYLKELFITDRVYVGPSYLWDLIDLPIKSLTLNSFAIDGGRLPDTLQAIHSIKSLAYLEIPCHWCLYRMSVEDFALFKDLPVKKVEIRAFDCLRLRESKHELEKLRKIMLQMKIEEITQERGYKEFKIISHGPGGMYKSI